MTPFAIYIPIPGAGHTAHKGADKRHTGSLKQRRSAALPARRSLAPFGANSPENGISPMPLVIGMSATPERFNKLVAGTTSTIYKSVVTAESVRNSGLLKDRIVITYPEENAVNKDMAILQAAADDWKEKWEHWSQYCQEQHYAYVNPIFVIQVLNGSNNQLSDTNLDDCLQKIEERTGFRFEKGQVVHTFGQTDSSVLIHGLEVPYKEPSGIADDRNIRIVFFKENLSTGWDCPRAETMMSFRHATDSTYIAQLLGRMVRTPMQMHIQVDDVLNDVHLYLPYFDADTVKEVVDALQSAEGGEIPTEVYGESLGRKTFETLTVKSGKKKEKPKEPVTSGQMSFDGDTYHPTNADTQTSTSGNSTHESSPVSAVSESAESVSHAEDSFIKSESSETKEKITEFPVSSDKDSLTTEENLFDREAVMKFINDAGLLTYHVRNVCISNYLTSLFKMVHLLTLSGLYPNAVNEVKEEIVQMIHEYIDNLKSTSKYDELVKQVKQFRLSTQIFDVFGESVDEYTVHDCFTTTDTDVDRQLRLAENKLANEGISSAYGNTVKMSWHDQNIYKIDVILFTSDEESMKQLNTYAETKFHELNDKYRRHIAHVESEKIRKQYDSIVSDGDVVSKHNFRLPETIQVSAEPNGKEYKTHLFVGEKTGTAVIKLNSWEEGVIAEEERRPDFVCWIRNPSRASWSLCIPYEIDNEIKPTYPDFIVIRKDEISGYVIDILEPHNPEFKDNLGKAKGFAKYASENPEIGRIQLIRVSKDAIGKGQFKRLDLSKGIVRNKVLHAVNNDELDHIFDTDGFFN